MTSAAPLIPVQPAGDANLLVFRLDERRYAVTTNVVERVTWMVSITQLPQAPGIVMGVVDVGGRVLPVVDPRKRFGLPTRDISVTDNLVIAQTARRRLVLAVDRIEGVVEYPRQKIQSAQEIVPGTGYIRGIAKLADGLVLIHDLDSFLSLEEEDDLDQALSVAAAGDESSTDGEAGTNGGDDAE